MANMFGPDGELLTPENEAEELYNRRIKALAAARNGKFVPTGDPAFDLELRKKIESKKQDKAARDKDEDTHQRNIENIRGGKSLQTQKHNRESVGPLGKGARELDKRAAELGVDPQFYVLHGEENSKLEAKRAQEEAERKARVEALAIAKARKAQFDNANNPSIPAHEKVGFEPSVPENEALEHDYARRNAAATHGGDAFMILHPTIDTGEEKVVDVTNPFTGQTSKQKDASVGSGAVLPGASLGLNEGGAPGGYDEEGNVVHQNQQTNDFARRVRAVAAARREKAAAEAIARQKAEDERQKKLADEEAERQAKIAKARSGVI